MTLLLHIGIDPATHLAGISAITNDGMALRPLEGFDGKQFSPHQTLNGGSSREMQKRLDRLEALMMEYFVDVRSIVYGLYGNIDWEIASIGIEKPAMTAYVQKGADGKSGNRFDTTFALGRAFQKAMDVAHAQPKLYGYDIAIYDFVPIQSSVALGLSVTANKKARNRRCAKLEGGVLIEVDEKSSDKDFVKGGNLHGCGPDALDAYAAAHAARKRYIEEQLANQARRESTKPRRTKRAA